MSYIFTLGHFTRRLDNWKKKIQKEHALENYVPDNPDRQIGDRWVAMKMLLHGQGMVYHYQKSALSCWRYHHWIAKRPTS